MLVTLLKLLELQSTFKKLAPEQALRYVRISIINFFLSDSYLKYFFSYFTKVLNKNQMVKVQVQKISRNLITILGLISIFIKI